MQPFFSDIVFKKKQLYEKHFAFTPFAQAAFAQNTGSVKYEQVIKLDMTPEMKAAMHGVVLPDQKTSFELFFSEEESLYKKLDTKEKNKSNVVMMGADADYFFYVNLAEKKTLEQEEFLGKRFLISGDWTNRDWKVTGETKMILGHPCLKAEITDTLGGITAWFAMDVKVPYGPKGYGQLPGLILELKIHDKTTIRATEINLKPLSEPIKKPKKGKKVTAEAYKTIKEEKLKELQDSYRQSGNRQVIRIGG